MKIMTVLLALSFSLNAFASSELGENAEVMVLEQVADADPTPIDVTGPIRILGSGVMNSSTGESMALVCVSGEDTCSYARFGLFKANSNEVVFEGPILHVPTGPNDRLRTKAMRLTIREFFDMHMTEAQKHKRFFWSRTFPSYTGAGLALAGVYFAAPLGITLGAGLCVYLLLSGSGTADFLSSNYINGTPISFTAQDGWNWSSRPHSMSDKKFNDMVSAIKKGNSSGVKENLGKYVERNERARKRLESKGVQF